MAQNSTESYRNKSVNSVRYGFSGSGDTLCGSRKRFLYYPGEKGEERSLTYFINHNGLYDEGVLEIKYEKGRKYLKSSDGKWYDYYDFIRSQIEHSIKRGHGRISWPNEFSEISLEEYLKLTEFEVQNAFKKTSSMVKETQMLNKLRNMRKENQTKH